MSEKKLENNFREEKKLEEAEEKKLEKVFRLVTIVGRRGSGVGSMALQLWKESGIRRALAYDPIAENGLLPFENRLCPSYIHERLDEKWLSEMMEYQETTKDALCWLIDNVAADKASYTSKEFINAIVRGKRCAIMTIYQSQMFAGIPRSIVEETDCWVISPGTRLTSVGERLFGDISKQLKEAEKQNAFLVLEKLDPTTGWKISEFELPKADYISSPYENLDVEAVKWAYEAFDGRRFLQELAAPCGSPPLKTENMNSNVPKKFHILMNPAFIKTKNK